MSLSNNQTTAIETLGFLLKTLKLPHMNNHWQELERQALAGGWTHAQFLLALCESEATQRYQLRVQRALKDAHLPPGKAFSNFDVTPLPQLKSAYHHAAGSRPHLAEAG